MGLGPKVFDLLSGSNATKTQAVFKSGSLELTNINLIIITTQNFFFPHQKRGCQFYFLMKKTIINLSRLKGYAMAS